MTAFFDSSAGPASAAAAFHLDDASGFGETYAPASHRLADVFRSLLESACKYWSFSWHRPHVRPTAFAKPSASAPARVASGTLPANSASIPSASWKPPWARRFHFRPFADSSRYFADSAVYFGASGDPAADSVTLPESRPARRLLPKLSLILLILATLFGALIFTLHQRPLNPPPGSPWQLLARVGLALGVMPDLPADWQVDLEQIPKNLAVIPGADQPLGELQNPFVQKDARLAWQAWHEGRFQDAIEPAHKAWTTLAKTDQERPLLAFLYAQTRLYVKDQPGALKAARVATEHPLLGGEALTFLAERADEQGQTTLVLTLLQGRTGPQNLLLRARALRRMGQLESAKDLLTQVHAVAGTALWRKQQLELLRLAHAGYAEDQAVALAQQLMSQAGKSAQTEEAVDFLLGGSDAVWQARLKKRPQDAPTVLNALVWTAQRRRYPRAIPALESLGKDLALPLAVRCHAQSWAAHAHDRKGELDASLGLLKDVAELCDTDDVRQLTVDEDPLGPGDAQWRLGRATLLKGNLDGTILLKKALDLGLNGLEADDAKTLLMLAALPDAGPKLKAHGATSANDYAERDIVDVMAWRFAMDAMTAGKWQDALKLLDRLVQVRDADATDVAFAPRPADAPPARYDDRDWARGRADYFAGRALQALGQDEAANARWKRVVVRHPLSYYAAMSLSQLAAAGEPMPDLPADAVPAGPQLNAKMLSQPEVQHARLLGQLGWHEEAGDLLDSVGLGRDVAGTDKWAAGDPAGAWARAALDDEAERWTSSHAMGRDALRRYATNYPNENNKLAWQIAYPRAFPALIEKAAEEFGLHPSIVWAIGRSESGFNPRVESHAAAIGLLQLILPTAQAMAKPLGLTADANTLRQPAVNVRLGARYLKSLLGRFDREAQMAAGYNAGGGAVGRWRKTRGDWPLDLFVEAIPFRETRDYAKRVVSSIAVYRNLYAGETLHTFALNQKPVPMQDEVPTEPSSTAGTQVAHQPQVAVAEHHAEVTVAQAEKPVKRQEKLVQHKPKLLHKSMAHKIVQHRVEKPTKPVAKAQHVKPAPRDRLLVSAVVHAPRPLKKPHKHR